MRYKHRRARFLAAGRLHSATMLAHITPLEAPIVWLAFAAGLALGIVATFVAMRRHAQRNPS